MLSGLQLTSFLVATAQKSLIVICVACSAFKEALTFQKVIETEAKRMTSFMCKRYNPGGLFSIAPVELTRNVLFTLARAQLTSEVFLGW
jgi:hypothetical protein